MTVRELQEVLLQCNPNAELHFENGLTFDEAMEQYGDQTHYTSGNTLVAFGESTVVTIIQLA